MHILVMNALTILYDKIALGVCVSDKILQTACNLQKTCSDEKYKGQEKHN